MRDIIFRGKRISDGEWVEGYLGVEVGGAPVIEYCGTDEDVGDYVEEQFVNPESIGEFTGLTDKNGRRVFEGDICWFYGGEHYGGNWETSAVIAITDMTNFTIMQYFYDAEYFEVIGNVFDNPELIELDVHKVETAESE